VEGLQALLYYLAAWLAATTLLYLRLRGREGTVTVTPLVLVLRTSVVFERFDRLRGSRLVGLLLDAGIVASLGLMLFFYANMAAGFLAALRQGRPTGMVAPILPGITIDVTTFLLLLPGLSLAIILHEMFHALAARHAGIPIRSSGFLVVLGVLPAAFVEPDEEALRRASRRARLRVYAAGVLANLLLFAAFQGLLQAAYSQGYYTVIVGVREGSPAAAAGIEPFTVVDYFEVNGTPARGVSGLTKLLVDIREANGGHLANITLIVTIVTPEGERITFTKPRVEIGSPNWTSYEKLGLILYDVPKPIYRLAGSPRLAWMLTAVTALAAAINLSLAAINAAPLFITDGTHILRELAAARIPEARAESLARAASAATLLLLLPNMTI